MCHAPIVVPEVGGARGRAVKKTTACMREAARVLCAHEPEVLVVLSPHTPRRPRSFSVALGPTLMGDFADFGAPEASLSLPVAEDAKAILLDKAHEADVPLAPIELSRLDHGALVPLYFVHRQGFRGRTLVVGLPARPTLKACRALGRVLREAARVSGGGWALLASGDMSHRLLPGAPAGFVPEARRFDEAVTLAVARGAYEEALAVDEALRELAAEDVLDPLAIAVGALEGEPKNARALSYEGPFGVGYLVAVLHDEQGEPRDGDDEDDALPLKVQRRLLDVAREAIFASLRGEAYEPEPLPEPYDQPAGVFVTLFAEPGHRLRGCVGRMEPETESLAREVASAAVAAATKDPRFSPVTSLELPFLSVEVSLLGPEEDARGVADLDPSTFGVSVTSGMRRGVLLPGIEGIDTAEEQLQAVLRKAGIRPDEPYRLKRFRARKIKAEP